MGSGSYISLVNEYRARVADFEKVASLVSGYVERACLRKPLLNTSVTHRAKAPLSLAKKLMLKPSYRLLSDIPDLAGARLTVTGLHDRGIAEEMIESMFPSCTRDDKTPYDPDRFGYLGVHYDVSLSDMQLSRASPNLKSLRCEIQLHTRVQGAWAVIAHDSVYKPSLMPTNEQRRHFNRLSALLEVFDHEAERGLTEMRRDPNLGMAHLVEGLQSRFFDVTSMVGNIELSLFLVPVLVNALYVGVNEAAVMTLVNALLVARSAEINSVVAAYANDDRRPLLSQPELLLIWERLDSDSYRTVASWPTEVDRAIIEDTATVLGYALPEE